MAFLWLDDKGLPSICSKESTPEANFHSGGRWLHKQTWWPLSDIQLSHITFLLEGRFLKARKLWLALGKVQRSNPSIKSLKCRCSYIKEILHCTTSNELQQHVLYATSQVVSYFYYPAWYHQNFFCSFEDTSRPDLQCPSPVVAYADRGETSTRVTWDEPVTTDNSGAAVPVQKVAGPEIGTFLEAGYYTVRYVATDDAGNEASCQFSVLVRGERFMDDILSQELKEEGRRVLISFIAACLFSEAKCIVRAFCCTTNKLHSVDSAKWAFCLNSLVFHLMRQGLINTNANTTLPAGLLFEDKNSSSPQTVSISVGTRISNLGGGGMPPCV